MLREKGRNTLVWPVDEFLYVTQGTVGVEVHGGESSTLSVGDVMVMRKGQTITFECSEDFANVAVFWALYRIIRIRRNFQNGRRIRTRSRLSDLQHGEG